MKFELVLGRDGPKPKLPITKNNGVGRCPGGTLDVGLFILDYKSAIFSGVWRVQEFCFSCFVNGH